MINMTAIYEPAGRAFEYSPLALNIYLGQCAHGCTYCYNNDRKFSRGKCYVAVDWNKLERDAPKYRKGEQILLSFAGDPYCPENDSFKATRRVLEILLKNDCTVAVLTKGGSRCLQDIDLFKQFRSIKVGATLTTINDEQSIKVEPGAALPANRCEALKLLHDDGVRTWVSLEPVIDPAETLKLIMLTHEYVDEFRIGKLNHMPEIESKIDWKAFGFAAEELCQKYGNAYYIKKDLREAMS